FRISDVEAGVVERLAAALKVSAVTARCLAARGVVDAGEARGWLEPKLGGLRKPVGLAGFTAAVERLARAVTTGERIGVFGDYDTVPAAGAAHPAFALVNPHRADSSFPFRGMASVGLAFYLVAALRTHLDGDGWFKVHARPEVKDLLDLVALGTIADLVP